MTQAVNYIIPRISRIITVTLNPTIDRIIEVPGLHIGGHLRGRFRTRLPAGKAINVSRALAGLGCGNIAAGWVGQDALGLFTDELKKINVQPRFTPIRAMTRENITIIDPDHHIETHIRDAGPLVTPQDIDRLQTDLKQLAEENAADNKTVLFVFTGSLAPGLSIDQYLRLKETCCRTGGHVAIDAYGPALQSVIHRNPWLIKPNLPELAELMNTDVEDDQSVIAAGRQLNRTIPVVLITMGERGAYCFNGPQQFFGKVHVNKDQLVSTVGCGDTFLAGFLATLCQTGREPGEALKQGLAAASASAMTETPATFEKAIVDSLLKQTEVKSLV
jgi:1-phosphofructokinase family hexose kinase